MTDHAPAGANAANIARQRRFWTSRAVSWDEGAWTNPGLVRVVDEVIARAAPKPTERAVDLGSGSGQLALKLAPLVESVLAVDISKAMLDLLERNAAAAGIANVSVEVAPAEHLELEPSSVDLIVSNYVLHHLRDEDKAALVAKAAQWLRPGGRLVVGDMMFGRGASARDREIIGSKLAVMLKKGPAGWWRIAKNAYRYLLRVQERPIPLETWISHFERAGLTAVVGTPVVNEAAVVQGTKPDVSPR